MWRSTSDDSLGTGEATDWGRATYTSSIFSSPVPLASIALLCLQHIRADDEVSSLTQTRLSQPFWLLSHLPLGRAVFRSAQAYEAFCWLAGWLARRGLSYKGCLADIYWRIHKAREYSEHSLKAGDLSEHSRIFSFYLSSGWISWVWI